ncbi:unnamed protein product [Phyllotreta striolata]|uniref:Trehalase n=1 Tax=Phyllotreta striolata TaxID=444603 RepID=A0A9N9XSY3_PHYSR|nr:unnamed protein product [Phyllotreta striolata]
MLSITPILTILCLYNGIEVEAESIPSCDNPVYCQGDLLDTVQMARLYPDSKTFVDMSQKNPPNVTLANFEQFMKSKNRHPSRQDIVDFVNDNFENSPELVDWTPGDYTKHPKFLERIDDAKVKRFAQSLVDIWPILARKINDSVAKRPDHYSLIYLPNGFIIPGGRFKEIYYWDTYWIIKGLIVSEMTDTVRGILENFLSLIDRFGFIPNGSRVYYLNRSQPPLLALMIGLYVDATNNKTWLAQHVDTVEKELNWWITNRRLQIKINDKEYDMFRYNVLSDTPRPESYYEDTRTCRNFTDAQKSDCYRNLKTGAESGWDYSTRWFFTDDRHHGTNLSSIDITHLIPVDLNAFLCKAFEELARFYELLGNSTKASFWHQRHAALKDAIRDVLYSNEDGIWFDYDLISNKRIEGFYPSNFAPLWADAYDTAKKEDYGLKATLYYKQNRLYRYLGGIPTSLLNSGQQWDLPNAWPPLQDLIVSGLAKTGAKKAVRLAENQAKRTIEAFMIGFEENKEMFEKYDAMNAGSYGGGGEYSVQAGFGWTNGAALNFIDLFYTKRETNNQMR